jgi:hypothetical protein
LPWQLASNEAAFPTQQGRATPPIFPKEEKKRMEESDRKKKYRERREGNTFNIRPLSL